MHERTSHIAFVVAAMLLPLLYLGSYTALVRRHTFPDGSCEVVYRLRGVKPWFAPIHYLDGKLRRDYWSCEWNFDDEPLESAASTHR